VYWAIRRRGRSLSVLRRSLLAASLLALVFLPTLVGVQRSKKELLMRAQTIYQLPEREFRAEVNKLVAIQQKHPSHTNPSRGPRMELHEIKRLIHSMQKTKTGREALALWIASGVEVIPVNINALDPHGVLGGQTGSR